ncbi:tyrosine-protein kinase domain-containing protein [uncultured Olleya sp.]|uniref:exopolysaccharide transport family protein n=1 Tax=uncultured Olleya sp. TaxID=757243 RepID=UPI002593B7D2|nr:tyrosine-protein kinase domain-containing protein [uncultured Olleya sp.]
MEDHLSNGNSQMFDFKAFVYRAISYWKWFVLLLIVGLYVVYQQNIRREFPYTLEASLTVQDDKNPLFTSNTSLVFNYGGISGKVQEVLLNLKSRKHHEKVVDSLNLYLTYSTQGRFYKTDIYGSQPFKFVGLDSAYQVIGQPIKINFSDANTFTLSYDFGEATKVTAQNYLDKSIKAFALKTPTFSKSYTLNEYIDLPFFKGSIVKIKAKDIAINTDYFIQYNNFNSTVSSFVNNYAVTNQQGSPLLVTRLTNKNKAKIVDYINTSVFILERDQLQRKNQYAINTVAFIDKQLARVKGQLNRKADSLNDFMRSNKIFDLENESTLLSAKIEGYNDQKEILNQSLLSYDLLKNYLLTSQDFTSFPAPALQGIDDPNISASISKIISLSIQKSTLESSVRDNVSVFGDLNNQIESLKNVMLENIASVKTNIGYQIQSINSKIYSSESQYSTLPESQQKLEAIEREYLLSQSTYNLYLAKRGEADLIKASNISDIILIEPAKDIGQGRNKVNLSIRYVFAVLAALIPIIILAFIITFFDNKIHVPSDLEKLANIPLLGVVGKNDTDNNLAVFNKPKSAVAEAFRAVRSSLQFIYKKHELEGTKTVMVTSSISGEGKTFCSINIASVFALSGKKTVLVGLDLRKPKIFGDFDIDNSIGAVNYLIGQKNLSEVVQKTKVEHLDVITSGPIPPNPSELLIGEQMDRFIEELKANYDYIVLDTPPLGLVADAFELIEYADASLYVVRQDYTKKEMLGLINDKHNKGEVKNISFLYNFYDQKGKYGYGYGYGYGAYGNGYHENEVEKLTVLNKIKGLFKK